MKFKRALFKRLKSELLKRQKILILFGARQTGKTTLSEDLIKEIPGKILKVNADELLYNDVLSSRELDRLKLMVEGYDMIFIDEAQRITNIGINLKLIYDNMPAVRVLATGSSSFELANKIKEPLTGRTLTHILYPISMKELRREYNPIELQSKTDQFLIYGLYPEVLNLPSANEKVKYLRALSGSYLYKDIFELAPVRNPGKLKDLLKLLAFQVGSEVSLNELSNKLGINIETVDAYIDLLEKSFVIFKLSGFSRNLRKEVTRKNKIYFWDLGVRNTLIDNYAGLTMRADTGALWENFIIAERLKYLAYNQIYASSYFWRIYTGAKLDYIEDRNGSLYAYEIKYNKAKKNPPKTWEENYSKNYQCITRDNFWEFVT
jgi:hypothetical protein